MKFLLLASFVIFCAAGPVVRNRNISVNDNGNILITSPNGRSLVIARQVGINGQRTINIAISGPNVPTRTIQVVDTVVESQEVGTNTPWASLESLGEEFRLRRGPIQTQGDVLATLFREYQGTVDETQYEKLLYRISRAVRRGEISPQIYELLQLLDQQVTVVGQGVQGATPLQVVLEQGVQNSQVPLGVVGVSVGQQGLGVVPLSGAQVIQETQGQVPVEILRRGVQGQLGLGASVPFTGVSLQGLTRQGVPTVLSSQIVPTGNGLNYVRQYLTTPNVNPLLAGLAPNIQGTYLNGLLTNQQLGVSTGLGRIGNQIVPQSLLIGGQYTPLLQNQQYPQTLGIQQTVGVPQSLVQQQQQIQQLNEVVEALEQLNELQQQQQLAQVLQTLGAQQQTVGVQYPTTQQYGVNLPTVQLPGQQTIGQVRTPLSLQQQTVGVQYPTTQQYGVNLPTVQLPGQQTIGQVRTPFTLQQLVGVPQVVGRVGVVGTQPVTTGIPTVQPVGVQGRTASYLNSVPQVQVVY